MLNTLMNWYDAHSAAHRYDIGFTLDGELYSVIRDELPRGWLRLDRMSSKRGGWAKVRVRIPAAVKRELVLSGEAAHRGPATMMDFADSYNNGEHYERVETEAAGQTWVKDSVPFWVAGDIRVDGCEVQIKFDGAEVVNERMMARLGA